MADLTLVIEDGSGVTGANTYITLEEADEYLGRLVHNRDWDGYDELLRTRAILTAFQIFGQLNWYDKATTYPTFSGSIPEAVKIGQAVFARRLAQRNRLDGLEQSAVVGSSNQGRSRSLQTGHPANASVVPPEVWGWIGSLVNLHGVPLVRVA